MFSLRDDEKLISSHEIEGDNWYKVSSAFGGRKTPEECRDRLRYLRQRPWTKEDIGKLHHFYNSMYPPWSGIAILLRRTVSDCIDKFQLTQPRNNVFQLPVLKRSIDRELLDQETEREERKMHQLFNFARSNSLADFERLIQETPILANCNDRSGLPILHYVSGLGLTEFAHRLLRAGAEIDALDGHNNTALVHAQISGNDELVQLLTFYGREARRIRQLFQFAQNNELANFKKTIQDFPILVNCNDQSGLPILHYVSGLGLMEFARTLLRAGADIDAVDGDNNKALVHAQRGRHHQLVGLLTSYGR